ncbi:MAG: hypothetical protein ABS911_05105 [Carnobacterium sp.]|uniref:hypothetical protein n=1 Tax=Carnobacterium sp. TaxID=48221 RepID=UPI0033156647
MDNMPYVIDLLKEQFDVVAEVADFGYESILLGRDELDPDLLPEYFDELQTGEELLVHFYNMEEYVIYIIAGAENNKWQLVGIIRDDYLVYSKPFN